MHFDLLVRGGRVVSPEGIQDADIGVRDGTIHEIGDLAQAEADEVLAVKGLHVFPGLIDSHVHFREPGAPQKEDLESGTRSAIAGGVTTVFDMPNTNPTTTTREALDDKVARLKDRAWCDVGFYLGASHENVDDLAELEGHPAVCAVKMFMGSSTGSLLVEDEPTQRRVLQQGTLPVAVHAEDEARLRERKALMSPHPSVKEHSHLRDEECARLAVEQIVRLSAETGRSVHVLHVSSAEEAAALEKAKAAGRKVTCEVTPHHLYLSTPDAYQRHGAQAQMNPPIRTAFHQTALRHALAAGLFDTIGSDHAPHTLEEKMRPYPASPSGIPGVQTLFSVLATLSVRDGLFPIQDITRWLGTGPAALYRLKGKGRVAVGADADFCIADVNLNRRVEAGWLQGKQKWSPYVGERLYGWPMHTVLRGQIAMRDEEIYGTPQGRSAVFERG
ncbi:MAG TPA: dihydroorotase [Fimbriimonadaceae bacterium]|nr:dihydroorotase [Fimbriimonadaceae bacterium]